MVEQSGKSRKDDILHQNQMPHAMQQKQTTWRSSHNIFCDTLLAIIAAVFRPSHFSLCYTLFSD